MPGLHLNHYVSWDDLLEICYVYEDPGIKLPICECGRIAAWSKKVKHQIKNRLYLADKLCTAAADCKIVGEKLFRKSEKRKLKIPRNIYCVYRNRDNPKIARFITNFSSAIKEFAETERKKIKERNIFEPKEAVDRYCEDLENKLYEDGKWQKAGLPYKLENGRRVIYLHLLNRQGYEYCQPWGSGGVRGACKLFSYLIEIGDIKTLLSMPNEKIKQVLRCCHGQAIGYNLMFLAEHVFQVYLYTNLIIACNFQDKPNEWGPMHPEDRLFRGELMHDCDGQTFLNDCKKYLSDEIYMKDFDAMKELCKKCFKFIYTLEMLGKEVGEEFTICDRLY